jgi:hypothetical protein
MKNSKLFLFALAAIYASRIFLIVLALNLWLRIPGAVGH